MYFKIFSINALNFADNLFESSGNTKPRCKVKDDHNLLEIGNKLEKISMGTIINDLGTF